VDRAVGWTTDGSWLGSWEAQQNFVSIQLRPVLRFMQLSVQCLLRAVALWKSDWGKKLITALEECLGLYIHFPYHLWCAELSTGALLFVWGESVIFSPAMDTQHENSRSC
jgi:hypothetical protein